jgi:hypothetical protein
MDHPNEWVRECLDFRKLLRERHIDQESYTLMCQTLVQNLMTCPKTSNVTKQATLIDLHVMNFITEATKQDLVRSLIMSRLSQAHSVSNC